MIVVPPEQQLIGRDEILDALLVGLRMKNSPAQLIVGAEGAGKTALASGLARKLHDTETGPLAGFTVTLLSAEQLLQAESSFELVSQTLEEAGQRAVVFVDDLDVSALIGGEIGTSRELLVALRTMIERRDRRLIFTISRPYVGQLQKVYPEFFDELQLVELPPLSAVNLHDITSRQAEKLAWFHSVTVDAAAIDAACSPRAPHDRFAHPALALQRLDRAAAVAAHDGTNIAVVHLAQQQRRFNREAISQGLAQRVKGQSHAIDAVVERLGISRTGLDLRPKRPDGVFLLAGPTGVGKSEFALALAEQLYGSDEAVIRLDMSEFRSEHEVSRLIGPPPGYKGSDRPEEWLTTKVIENPHRVLLLDEFEKADPAVWQTFLQVFDAGRLTDGRGRVADFRDTVILLTSNIGAETFTDRAVTGFGEGSSSSAAGDEQSVLRAIKDRLAPELVNRLDRVLVFRPLTPEAVLEITRNQLDTVQLRVAVLGYTLEIHDSVAEFLAKRGYSRAYGARPLQRTVEAELLVPVSQLAPGSYSVRAGASALEFSPAV